MSAWVCSPQTIGKVAIALKQRHIDLEAVYGKRVPETRWLAAHLARVNLRSVGYRYGMTEARAAREFRGCSLRQYLRECVEAAESTLLENTVAHSTPSQILGLVSGYTYQACEHPEHEQAKGYRAADKLIENLRRAGVQREGWAD